MTTCDSPTLAGTIAAIDRLNAIAQDIFEELRRENAAMAETRRAA